MIQQKIQKMLIDSKVVCAYSLRSMHITPLLLSFVTSAGRGDGSGIFLFVDGVSTLILRSEVFFGEACPTKYVERFKSFDLSRLKADLILIWCWFGSVGSCLARGLW